ncbi:MAG TPA: Lrp/AsnC family transcriptional regulator [Solirubrobacteraceae bacterium]|nr:Lrp/AsnC family transcriptional regulator [Solirubrobacteraceae bacterium]
MSKSIQLDATDAGLLLELGADVRLSATELAARLRLSRNTVQARLARLEHAGLLRFAATLDQVDACGLALTAFVTIDIAQHEFQRTKAALAEIPEVIEAHGITGDGDLWCRVVAHDAADLGRVLDQLGACPGVRRTRTSLAIRDAVDFRVDTILRARTF